MTSGDKKLRVAVTGFVSSHAGSVAAANALLIRGLLNRECAIHFFSKASFVDPRPIVGDHPFFQFTDVDNFLADRLRARTRRWPLVGLVAAQMDSGSYNRLLARSIRQQHEQSPFDVCLWLGDYARGRVNGLPALSFVQGPPGTDARSILRHQHKIAELAGRLKAAQLNLLARVRLSPLGVPPISCSDHLVVGSKQSVKTLHSLYNVPGSRISCLPYPIDLHLFSPRHLPLAKATGLRCIWIGRIIPRKRLDLFLDAAALAIQNGIDLRVTIIGSAMLVPEYERLIHQFPFPDRLTWQRSMPRLQIPELLARHDLLVQPSEEENFGSSVAEAQACGLPVIVGATNGNSDYLSACDIRLPDYEVGSLAKALSEMAGRKMEGRLTDKVKSRQCAEQHFALENIVDKLLEILQQSAGEAKPGHSKDLSRTSTGAVTIGTRQMHDARLVNKGHYS